jgi:hypothetical protein
MDRQFTKVNELITGQTTTVYYRLNDHYETRRFYVSDSTCDGIIGNVGGDVVEDQYFNSLTEAFTKMEAELRSLWNVSEQPVKIEIKHTCY